MSETRALLTLYCAAARAFAVGHSAAALSSSVRQGTLGIKSPLPLLFDVDCNAALMAANLPALLAEARVRGVAAIFVPGSSLDDSEAPLPARVSNVEIFRSAGVHPFDAKSPPRQQDLERLDRLLSTGKVACGECGLDSSPGFPPLDVQIEWFKAQIDLAVNKNLPLFAHERGAHKEFMQILGPRISELKKGVMVHCFTGNPNELLAYNRAGFYISISGVICRNGEPGATVRRALQLHPPPSDRLCIETDAPYMGFPGCRGRSDKRQSPNVPSALPLVLSKLAEVLNANHDALAHSCTATALDFFGIDSSVLAQSRAPDLMD